jgi:hypothetical protein
LRASVGGGASLFAQLVFRRHYEAGNLSASASRIIDCIQTVLILLTRMIAREMMLYTPPKEAE